MQQHGQLLTDVQDTQLRLNTLLVAMRSLGGLFAVSGTHVSVHVPATYQSDCAIPLVSPRRRQNRISYSYDTITPLRSATTKPIRLTTTTSCVS